MKAMRDEQMALQHFCSTFAYDGVKDFEVMEPCIAYSAARFGLNYSLATKSSLDEEDKVEVLEFHNTFCSQMGNYAKPGMNARKACESWNRNWDKLFVFSQTKDVDPVSLREKLKKLEYGRLRFCDTIVDRNDGDGFGGRVENCRAAAKFATATDRAIILGEF